ncbi:MAG TPA: LptA/OstA family protein [Candidatus Baltobacteraceae bacterium]|jgi:lipopolysaccharide assembly outer membrane protein LptD (OstA)|nr:LptA/OstA family protein [Candidatus Baltobacteraceae bacterium]
MKVFRILAFLLPVFFAQGGFAVAAPPVPSNPAGATADFGGFQLQVQAIDYNDKTGNFTIADHFTGTREGTEISGDHAKGNSRTKMMEVFGHVVVHQTAPLEPRTELSSVGKEPATLTCDRLTIDGNQKLYTAIGDVHYLQGTQGASAERGSLNQTTHIMHMEGHVHMQNGDQSIDADSVDYNTQTGQGHAGGHVSVHQTASLESEGAPPTIGNEPVLVTCDRLTIDERKSLYTADGNVHYSQGTRNAVAELGTLNEATHMVHMERHVHMQDVDQSIDADSVDYYLKTGEGHAVGNIILRGPAQTGVSEAATPAPPSKKKKKAAPPPSADASPPPSPEASPPT